MRNAGHGRVLRGNSPSCLPAPSLSSPCCGRGVLLTLSFLTATSTAFAQLDPIQEWNESLRRETNEVFGFTFEERTRWERRYGVNFGRSADQEHMLSRVRLGAQYKPYSWLKISAMAQDGRAPFFGVPAPNSLRDSIDLQESYVQLFPDRKVGFGAIFGRQMLNYGETNMIASPQWAPLARTFDSARVYYQRGNLRFEVLMVSPVTVRTDSFNTPNLGDRIWGTYNVFGQVFHGVSIDAYALRHSQNAIGGWNGAGTRGTNTFGSRFYGPLPGKFTFNVEGIGQTGHEGTRTQRAFASVAQVTRGTTAVGRPLNLTLEYRLASGTKSGSTNGGTYDQLYPANHEKFGHMDLFGWRNVKTIRALASSNLTKRWTLNLMYSDYRLYSATDALYNIGGSAIAASSTGTAGTHVGQEFDVFATYSLGSHFFGAGFGHFFKGEFIGQTTPNVNPRYFYVFQQYSFK